MKPEFLLLAGWLSIQALGAQTAAPTVDQILARVQTNTGQFEASLPDFTCDETIVARRIEHGVMARDGSAESHFTGLQKASGRMSFTESREYVTINGAPAVKGQRLGGAFLFEGAFSSLLDGTFSTRAALFHDYQIAGREKCNNRPALVIKFATKRGQSGLRAEWGGRTMVQRDRGTAWIDEETLQVLRIERRFMNLPPGWLGLVARVNYGAVTIDGKPFWMPIEVEAERSSIDNVSREYRAEYRNYRKFEVSSGISFQPQP